MSLRCVGIGSQQTSQLSRIIDEQRVEIIELETLQRENKVEAAESAQQISGLRLRVVELETQVTQLGRAHSVIAPNSEAKHGSSSGGAPFMFCLSAGIIVEFVLLRLFGLLSPSCYRSEVTPNGQRC